VKHQQVYMDDYVHSVNTTLHTYSAKETYDDNDGNYYY